MVRLRLLFETLKHFKLVLGKAAVERIARFLDKKIEDFDYDEGWR